MTAFDKKINQIATRHRWNIEKQARAAVPCYITAAALAAALLAGAPRAAAVCPYTVGPLGRYIAPATVQGMTATDDGNAVEVWCTDALDGDDWFFTVDNKTELKIYSRVNLVIDANGTPDDYSDDKVIDALFCNDCTED